jgi:hypothetical protein
LTRPRRAEQPPGVLPRFGNGPAWGAGKTGFNSSNVRTRRTRQSSGTGRDATAKGASAKKPPPLSPPPPPKTARPGKTRPAIVATPPGLPSAAQTGSPDAAPRAQLGGATAPDTTGVVPPSDAVALPPPVVVQPRQRPIQPEPDPFAPTGIHAGTFMLRPALEVMTGYDTNPARSANNPKGSPQLTVAPELLGTSDWERHQLDIAIRGAYYYYPDVSFADRPNVDARADGRIDVSKDTRIDVQGRLIV